jgi:hypothetical protein
MGVLVPAIFLGLLLGVPRRWAAGLYLIFVAALVTYFFLGQSYAAMAVYGQQRGFFALTSSSVVGLSQ